jgi:hypothetical protein
VIKALDDDVMLALPVAIHVDKSWVEPGQEAAAALLLRARTSATTKRSM